MASHLFQFLEKNAAKSERERPSTLRDCPLSCYFSGMWPQLRDTLSTSRSIRRGTGAFIYALSAVETRPALAAPRHASTALFSCRFKCPYPPRQQRHFHCNAGRANNTLHFASQSHPALRLYRLSKSKRGNGVVSFLSKAPPLRRDILSPLNTICK